MKLSIIVVLRLSVENFWLATEVNPQKTDYYQLSSCLNPISVICAFSFPSCGFSDRFLLDRLCEQTNRSRWVGNFDD
jgi:hypothetical protein